MVILNTHTATDYEARALQSLPPGWDATFARGWIWVERVEPPVGPLGPFSSADSAVEMARRVELGGGGPW